MKHFANVRRFVFSRKSVVVPVVLATLGLSVGGEFLAQQSQQSLQFADSVNCYSNTEVGCNTASPGDTGQPTQTSLVVSGQHTHSPYQPKRLPTVVAHSPAPNSALRIIPPTPTPAPTNSLTGTTPTPTPVPGGQPGQAGVVAMIKQVFGPYAQAALQVAKCESGYNPNAYNPISIGGSHAEGVFQILYPSTWMSTSQRASSPYDASANIHAAYEIFARDGYNWHEWSCAS